MFGIPRVQKDLGDKVGQRESKAKRSVIRHEAAKGIFRHDNLFLMKI